MFFIYLIVPFAGIQLLHICFTHNSHLSKYHPQCITVFNVIIRSYLLDSLTTINRGCVPFRCLVILSLTRLNVTQLSHLCCGQTSTLLYSFCLSNFMQVTRVVYSNNNSKRTFLRTVTQRFAGYLTLSDRRQTVLLRTVFIDYFLIRSLQTCHTGHLL